MMLKPVRTPMLIILILVVLALPLVIPVGKAQGHININAPLAPGHNINFYATGVPDGISFTISGTRMNNGGNPTSYTTTFSTPNVSASVGADPGSTFIYSGFPASITVGTQDYQLISTLPASPFIVGSSGGATTVTATYAATCSSPSIQTDPGDQTVVFGDPVVFAVAATGTSPLTYEWYKDGTQIPGEDQSTFSILSASVSDSGLYHAVVSNACGTASSNQAQLTVNKANQAITFDQPASLAVFGTTFVVSPTASSGLTVELTALGSCTNSGYEVSMTSGVGICTLIASQPGDVNYNPAGDVVRTVDAAKAGQVIDFPAPQSPAVYGSVFFVTLSASSGLPVNLTSDGGCSNDGAQVTMTSGSTACTLTASQAGDDNYNPAADVQNAVEAQKADQSITLTPPVSPAAYATSFDLEASASSGLPVSFDVSGVCGLAGTTVSMIGGTGTCTIVAMQAGDDNYNPATNVISTIEAARASQVITFDKPASPVKYQTSFTVVPASDSNLSVTLAASGSCTTSGYTVTMTKTYGTCMLTASQEGDFNYLPAEDVQHTVDPAPNGNILFIPLLFGS
jgi:hypothetical protein